MTEQKGLSPNEIIATLTRSPHGKLEEYVPIGTRAAQEDPDFFAHLIAWNDQRGQIRDSKVALPVLALTAPALSPDVELRDNAYAHLLKLPARDLLRGLRFSKSVAVRERRRLYDHVELYLRDKEAVQHRFDRVALQHRRSLQELYALLHIKPGKYADDVLFKNKKPGVFGEVARLKDMAPADIAATILKFRLPFLVVSGALGAKVKDPTVVHALIGAMSPTELVTNTAMLKKMGMDKDPALRGAYEAALKNVSTSGANLLKTTRAADAVGGATAEKLRGAQERQLDNSSVEGDWLILADKSPSMAKSLDVCRKISDVLSRMAKGRTHLVYFDEHPKYFDVTGKAYDEIVELTKRITVSGGTNIGCGMDYALRNNLECDGIAIVSDGGDYGGDLFERAYERYSKLFDREVPIYFYKLAGDTDTFTARIAHAGLPQTVFDLRGGVDFYSLPNIVQTMRTNRYSLHDEIAATPLLRLKDVLRNVEAKPEPVAA